MHDGEGKISNDDDEPQLMGEAKTALNDGHERQVILHPE